MTNLKEMKFAFENGFTNVEFGKESDGSFYVWGTFGYVVYATEEEVKEVKDLLARYLPIEETTQEETTQELTIELTVKERKVLKALLEETYEYGLPVSVEDIKDHTNMSKRSIVGVISSLYKKGIVEEYAPCGEDYDEFILTESAISVFS